MNTKRKTSVLFILSFFMLCAAPMAFGQQPGLVITSSAFKPNSMIPAKYSCEGAGVSPPLQITGIPSGAKSLAIIVHDPDAPKPGGVTHWVVWNLPVNRNIAEGYNGATQGLNSDNKPGYMGMCPPFGTHRYFFKVYALDTQLSISDQSNTTALEKAMQNHVLAQGQLIGLYTKDQ